MRLHMLKLCVGKGRQVIKQLCSKVLQYYSTVATERVGYVLYRALVIVSMETMELLTNPSLHMQYRSTHPSGFVLGICASI